MKALTIRQPWASLIALGDKRIETRSWRTRYRGPLLIHAGKNMDKQALKNPIIRESLESININEIPVGMIVAKCNLVDCLEMVEWGIVHATLSDGTVVNGNEYIFGDYEVGRYAWILDNIEMLKEPIPAKGKLSLWEYKG